jgi:hypothetical protein
MEFEALVSLSQVLISLQEHGKAEEVVNPEEAAPSEVMSVVSNWSKNFYEQ